MMCNSDRDTATDACCRIDASTTTDNATVARWLDEDGLDAQLPADLQQILGSFFDQGSVETLGAWAAAIRHVVDGTIAVDQLCHADEPTDHWGEIDGERYHFQCFYDAVILSAIENRPVAVHTVSPGGTGIEARAAGTDSLSVTPENAVFSLGVGHDAAAADGEITIRDAYAAICPYVKAFPDRDAYESWAETVPAATVATPLAGATTFARALVGSRAREIEYSK